jgi:hypothetical protein
VKYKVTAFIDAPDYDLAWQRAQSLPGSFHASEILQRPWLDKFSLEELDGEKAIYWERVEEK